VFSNPTEVIHNVATNTTDRTMQPSETPWINRDPHFTTAPHYSHEEDNLDWEVLEHPPHRGTITDRERISPLASVPSELRL